MIRYRRFKFPSKTVATPLLYVSGKPIYIDMYDNHGNGIPTEEYTVTVGGIDYKMLRTPIDGSYHADIIFREESVPLALQEFLIAPISPSHEWLDDFEGGLL